MSDWFNTTLGAVVEVRVSNVDKKSLPGERSVRLCNYRDVYSTNAVTPERVLMAASATESEYFRFRLLAGDVVITKDSESPDDIAVPTYIAPGIGEDVVCGYHLAMLRPKPSVDGHFLSYLLRLPEVNLHFAKVATGSTRYGLGLQSIHDTPLRIPKNLAEQRGIAEVLSALDEQIEATEALVEKFDVTRAGLVRDLLVEVQSSPRLPLKQLAEVSGGVTLGREFTGSGIADYPYLRVANVQDGRIDLTEVKTIRIPIVSASKAMLQAGDVLMNEGGDFDKLGRGAVWNGQIPHCLHQNHVFRVRCDKTRLLPGFLALWAASDFGKRFFILASKQSTNLASINSTQLKSFPVLTPSIEKQQEIMDAVESIDAIQTANKAEAAKLHLQKQGLMRDLLTGAVRVTRGVNA